MSRARVILAVAAIVIALAAGGCRAYKEYEAFHDDVSPGGYYQSQAQRDVDEFNRSIDPNVAYE